MDARIKQDMEVRNEVYFVPKKGNVRAFNWVVTICFVGLSGGLTFGSAYLQTGLRNGTISLSSVSDAVTETSSAMALAPSTPSSQLAMPMLTMLLPFMAAISSSEAAWLMSL